MIDKLEEPVLQTGLLQFFDKILFCNTFRTVECWFNVSTGPILFEDRVAYVQSQ